MHEDEVDVGGALVRRLLAAQFPQWAELPLEPFAHGGTDHFIYRLGDELQVRLPKHEPSTGQVEKELELLPRLAPHLPVEVPAPLARGEPGGGYPFTWGVYRWLPGEQPQEATLELARDVAAFIRALQAVDTAAAPPPSARGGSLRPRDNAFLHESLDALAGEWDVDALREAWARALAAPDWDRAPVWLHGDLLASNLLVRKGRLAAVLDWGTACAGDPAADCMLAWSLLDPVRDALRAALAVDDATWARGRGWALWQAAVALPYYRDTNPPMAAHARAVLANVLADRTA